MSLGAELQILRTCCSLAMINEEVKGARDLFSPYLTAGGIIENIHLKSRVYGS